MHNYSKQYTMQQDTTLIGLQAHIKQMQIELDVAHQAIATQHDHIHNIYIDLKEAKYLLDHNLKATNQGIDVSLAFEERLDRNSKELQQLYHEVELLHARLDKAER